MAEAPGTAETDDPLLAEAAALRAHPRFAAAVDAYTAGQVRFQQSSRLVNRLSAHEARFRTVGYLLHLAAVSRTGGGDGAVSYGQLMELCVDRRGEVGPRVLKTMLAVMSLAGFVSTRRDAADRRVKLYQPTPRMLDFAKLWFQPGAEGLDAMEPQLRRADRLAHEQAFLDHLLVHAGSDHASAPPAERLPEFISFFGGRQGASAVIARLAAMDAGAPPVASRAALARQFGLSKTQVSDVIADGVRRGFMQLGDGAMPVLTERLRGLYRRWISIELAFYARHMPAGRGAME